MDSSSTDALPLPLPDADPAPRDTVWFWLLLAAVITAVVAVAIAGVQWLTLLGLMQVPVVLATLLLARAGLRLARGQPTALHVGHREVLGGPLALAVPLAFLVVWSIARERDWFGTRLARTTHTLQTTTNVTSGTASGGGTVHVSEAAAQAQGVEMAGADGALREGIAAALRGVPATAPWLDVRGVATTSLDPPFALWPLCKVAQMSGSIEVELLLARPAPADERAMLKAKIAFDGRWTMLGFAAQRDFHAHIGAQLGASAQKALAAKIRELLPPVQ